MTACPYDLVIGLDRSDQKADLCLLDVATGQRRTLTIDTSPEALWEWLGTSQLVKSLAQPNRCGPVFKWIAWSPALAYGGAR